MRLVFLLLLLAASNLAAGSASAEALSDGERRALNEQAAALHEEGTAAFLKLELEQAMRTLDQAARLAEEPALLAKIHLLRGQVLATRREYPRAEEAFLAALEQDPDARLDPARVNPRTVELFDALRGRLEAELSIQSDRPALVFLDEKEVGSTPYRASVPIGRRKLRVSTAARTHEYAAEVILRPKRVHELALALPPVQTAVPAPTPAPAAPAPPKDEALRKDLLAVKSDEAVQTGLRKDLVSNLGSGGAPAQRALGEGWAVAGGALGAEGRHLLHVEGGWPGLTLRYLRAYSDSVDRGLLLRLDYGYFGAPAFGVVPGGAAGGIFRVRLYEDELLNFGARFEPAALFYAFPRKHDGMLVGLSLPGTVTLGFSIVRSFQVHLGVTAGPVLGYHDGFAFDVPVQPGFGFELKVGQRLGVTFDARLGGYLGIVRGSPGAHVAANAALGLTYRL